MKRFSVLLLAALFSQSILADMRQALPGMAPTMEMKEDDEKSAGNPFLPGAIDKEFNERLDKDVDTYFLRGKNKDIDTTVTDREKILTTNQSLPGQLDNSQYVSVTKKEILSNVEKEVRDNFSFTYYKDTFDYKNSSDNFDRMFRTEADGYGILRVSWDRFFYKGWTYLSYGVGVGVGYNSGKGKFKTSDSGEDPDLDANIILWTLPLDLSLKVSVPMTSYLRFYVGGGPSAMGIIQHRQDKPDGDKQKSRRQASYGYFGNAGLKINLGKILTSTGFSMYKSFGVGQFHLTIEGRTHEYENFKSENVSISGSSLGAGFSFDFL